MCKKFTKIILISKKTIVCQDFWISFTPSEDEILHPISRKVVHQYIQSTAVSNYRSLLNQMNDLWNEIYDVSLQHKEVLTAMAIKNQDWHWDLAISTKNYQAIRR